MMKNGIVSYLLDYSGIDMNHLMSLSFTKEDRQQFAQLIGYSISDYRALSYVDDRAWQAANSCEVPFDLKEK